MIALVLKRVESLRVLLLRHAFVAEEVLDIATCFLNHNNSEVSYQTMNEIKEQSLRLLLFVCARGEVPMVLRQMTQMLKQPTVYQIDASLTRYFVSGLLEIAKLPFSMPFCRLFCALLAAPGTVEAVKTSYFKEENRKQLRQIIHHIQNLETASTNDDRGARDTQLFNSIVAIYDN